MTLGGTLTAVDRWRRGAPRSLTAAARLVAGSAVVNARLAAQALSAQVDERRALIADPAGVGAGTLASLSEAECRELLATRSLGRLAYVARAGVVDIVPVNYTMDGGTVLLRSGPGPKLQAAERREIVAFEVDDIDEQTRVGWSVVVTGVALRVGPEQAALTPGAAPEPWATGPRRYTVRITPRRIDGRRLH